MADGSAPLSERPKLSLLDIVVFLEIVAAILFGVALVVIGGPAAPWLNGNRLWLDIVALAEAAILLIWIFVDGVTSPLWRWLPPFCTFPKVIWVRWFVVLAMVCGTIAGVVADALAR